jgi:hypothetical protein
MLTFTTFLGKTHKETERIISNTRHNKTLREKLSCLQLPERLYWTSDG